MKVFVSGATGFIGERLARSLVADGYHVRSLVHPAADPAAIAALGVETIGGDVGDLAIVRRALAGCEVVYHLAGLLPGKARTPAEYHAVNVQGTENVMRVAVESRVRHVVHCSTVAVHGLPRRNPADEEAPLAPSNVYGASKLEGERVVQRFVRAHGLSVVVVRPIALYGPGDLSCLKLFRDVARGRLVMIGSGQLRCQLAYIDDVVTALRICGARGQSNGECFIIGGEERPTINELLRVIAEEIGVGLHTIRLPSTPFAIAAALYRSLIDPFTVMPGFVDRLDFFTAERTFDLSRAKRELGFHPSVALRDGIRRTAEWYRRSNHL
jgi:nucleoside-diphosphate-sugar epimerase